MLILSSDNDFYRPIEMDVHQLREVWAPRIVISPFMDSPGHIRNSFPTQISQLQETIQKQSELIASLNNTIEALLRQQRRSAV